MQSTQRRGNKWFSKQKENMRLIDLLINFLMVWLIGMLLRFFEKKLKINDDGFKFCNNLISLYLPLLEKRFLSKFLQKNKKWNKTIFIVYC